MDRKKIESSRIASIGHDGKSTLEIEFHNEDVWQYTPVSAEGFIQMQKAESIGKWFQLNIIKNGAINSKKVIPC